MACIEQKKSRHTHQNPLKSSPVSGRSPYPLQNYVCFSSGSPLGQRVLATNLLPLIGPGLNCPKSQLVRNIHTHSSQLFTLKLAHHYIQQALSTLSFFFWVVCFFFGPRGFLRSTTRPHQSTARPLERAANHIKVTHPPCLFRLPPWENVNRSITLIHRM